MHVPAFRAVEGCQVVAICASSQERASAAAERLSIPLAFGEWSALVESEAIDAISIAVPPTLQTKVALAAIQAGKHILCEKPVAMCAEDALRLYAAACQAGITHGVDFMFPELPVWHQAKRLIDSGAIGKLRHATLQWRVETRANRFRVDSWKVRPTEGGGALYNFVPHVFYNLEWLLGPIVRLTGRVSSREGFLENLAEGWLELRGGIPVSFSVATDAVAGSGHHLEVYGDDGALALRNETGDYTHGFELWVGHRMTGWEREAVPDTALNSQPSAPSDRVTAMAPLAQRFIRAIVDRKPFTPGLGEGVRVQQLLDLLRDSALSEQWNTAPAPDDSIRLTTLTSTDGV